MEGLHVGQGSDWQTANPTPNPFIHIEGLVTREHPTDPEAYPGAVNPSEAITLEQAIAMSTLEGAWVLGVEDEIGSSWMVRWCLPGLTNHRNGGMSLCGSIIKV